MSNKIIHSVKDLIPVDIKAFRNVTRNLHFDVYIKLAENNIAHIFSKTTGIDYKRLAQYIQKGIKELYIHPEDQPLFQEFISQSANSIFNDSNTSKEKKISALMNMTDQNLAEIFSQFSLGNDTIENTQKLIQNYINVMTSSPTTLTLILKLASQGEYLYYHSIAVAIFSMFIAKAAGQFNQRMLEIVGMGGFLHDIGCTQLPKEVYCSQTDFTPDQWTEMRSHTRIGLKMLEKLSHIPDEVRYIVYQHHEEPSGNGYPNAIHGPVIYYPAKIVAIADSFSALIMNRPFRAAHSIEDAIKIIQNCSGKYDRELVKILASVFIPSGQMKKAA